MNDLIIRQVDQARGLLLQAKNAPQAKKVADMAHAAEIYAKRQQMSQESIDLAHAVRIDAMTLLGDFLSRQEKQSGARGTGSNQHKKVESRNGTPPTIKDHGITKKESSLSQRLFKMSQEAPDKHAAIREAKAPVSSVLTSAHVANNSGNNEWYTPPEFIAAAVKVMGAIDLDPASSKEANSVVQAKRFFTKKENGLKQQWSGRVWMNPPYELGLIKQFSEKFAIENISEGICLVNNATETNWFQTMARACSAMCFPSKRIRFWSNAKSSASPLQGQAILYRGMKSSKFVDQFKSIGVCVHVVH
jgi:ParB family chromosome partitioning protein